MYKIGIMLLSVLFCVAMLFGCAQTPPQGDSEPAYTQGETEETNPWEAILSYEEYLKMDSDGRSSFYDSFETPADFHTWHMETKALYDARNQENQMGANGYIDMDKIDKTN